MIIMITATVSFLMMLLPQCSVDCTTAVPDIFWDIIKAPEAIKVMLNVLQDMSHKINYSDKALL